MQEQPSAERYVEKSKATLVVELTAEEISQSAKAAAEADETIGVLEEELKELQTQKKAQIQAQRTLVARALKAVRTGSEEREVECEDVFDFRAGTVTRMARGKALSVREIRKDEWAKGMDPMWKELDLPADQLEWNDPAGVRWVRSAAGEPFVRKVLTYSSHDPRKAAANDKDDDDVFLSPSPDLEDPLAPPKEVPVASTDGNVTTINGRSTKARKPQPPREGMSALPPVDPDVAEVMRGEKTVRGRKDLLA